ncbi:MAG: YibE/F family protein [Defluviitaleaceae bacterium]|nr:YibE/F family protein [Defluviitaleaceae bacterium]
MLKFNRIFYVVIILLSVGFLFFGNRIASRGMIIGEYDAMPVFSARVVEIIDRYERVEEIAEDFVIRTTFVRFLARISSGDWDGAVVFSEQTISTFDLVREREIAPGDRIMLFYNYHTGMFFFMDYARISFIYILAGAFLLLIVAFARQKGFNSIVALGFICAAIFGIFLPAILSGMNIYATAAIISVYSIIFTLLIVIGPNRKAFSAMLGCLGGVLLAGLLMLLMDNIMHLTGLIDHESRILLNIPVPRPIDLRAIIFAGVIIGSTGAIMDVAMSISSSLWEVQQGRSDISFADIFKSGLEIGKDILGTMLNTLILAYIGSSLTLILLIYASTTTMFELLNMELIIVEFLRALVGSFGMFLTIPLTAAISGILYTKTSQEEAS